MANLRQEALETIPATPGVYLFKDQDDNIIYVGKAKNLRPRVKSYFQASPGDGRSLFRIIVKNTADIEMVVAAMGQECRVEDVHVIVFNEALMKVSCNAC